MGKPKRKPSPFGNLLTQVMKEKHLSIREAAKLAGVNPSTIQSWRTGSAPEDYLALKKLAEAMGTTLSYLLTGENDTLSANPPIAEIFQLGDTLFDGFAKITIQRIIPRSSGKKSDEA